MPQSSPRVRCPRCQQKLRVLHAAEYKTSITCPLCRAKVPLRPHDVYEVGPPPLETDIRSKDSTIVYYEGEEDNEEHRTTYLPSWTITKTVRLALAVIPFFAFMLGTSPFLRALSRLMHAPSPFLGMNFATVLFIEMFWLGLGLWLANVSDSFDWEPIAKLLCFGGFLLGILTVVVAIFAGYGGQIGRF